MDMVPFFAFLPQKETAEENDLDEFKTVSYPIVYSIE